MFFPVVSTDDSLLVDHTAETPTTTRDPMVGKGRCLFNTNAGVRILGTKEDLHSELSRAGVLESSV